MSDKRYTAKGFTHKVLKDDWDLDQRPVRRKDSGQTEKVDTTSQKRGSETTRKEEDNHPFLHISGKCLVGLDFSDLDLKFAVFTNCDLSSASFERCNLFKAAFINCILYNTKFDKAVLVDVKFHKSKLFGIRLLEAEVHGLGDCTVSALMSREHDSDGKLAFRGTAGHAEWKFVHDKGNKNTFFKDNDQKPKFPAMENNGNLPKIVIDSPYGGKLIPGINDSEIIEICPLHSDLLWERLEDLKRQRRKQPDTFLALNIPRPPGDAFPEDSTCMTLRDFRRCFERQGNRYPASDFRYWETTYLAASKLRVMQSEILQTHNKDRSFRPFRWFFSLPVAFLAWSLLHPKDERRYSGLWGRNPLRRSSTETETQTTWLKAAATWLKGQLNGESLIGSCLHAVILFASFFALLALFTWTALGIGITIGSFIYLGITICLMVGTKTSNDKWLFAEIGRVGKDVYFACIEFIQHTVCGHGEKSLRAAGALGAWIVLFGILYTIFPSHCIGNEEVDLNIYQGLYYSIVSATTLGFGDITPSTSGISNASRLVCIEVIGAVILTATLLASLTRKFIGR